MFEGIIISFIVFAGGYTLLMRVMARRADVLHGEFIQRDGTSAPETALSWLANIQRYAHYVRSPIRR